MPKSSPADIRDRIRAERIRLGLSIPEAAERLGISRQSYLQLEIRTVDPRISTIVKLVAIGMRLGAIVPELKGRR